MAHDATAVREKQRQVWDVSDDPRWRLTIYEPLYGGKIYANNGGPALLDYMGLFATLRPEHRVLELGSGMGDACEYVASHFGCRVTGVELSSQQVERARARHGDRHLRGFDFVEADMMQWEPADKYDVVYFGDMLGVAQDRYALLQRVHRWLRPGGAMVLTDLVAGAGLSAEDRDFIWREDGFEVINQTDSLAQIAGVGFEGLDVLDQTNTVVTMQQTILQASYRRKSEMIEAVGMDRWLSWVDTATRYRRLFADRKLVSLRVGAFRS